MRRQLPIILVLLLIGSVYAVSSVTHPAQKAHCLRICHEPITACINLRHNKCLKSYHTCLSKAKDFYRCTNSSKIKQLKDLTKCMRDKCDEVPEYNYTLELMSNPYRTMHRELPPCMPWLLKGNKIVFGRVMAPEDRYSQSQRYQCQVIARSNSQNTKKQKGKSKQVDQKPRCGAQFPATSFPRNICRGETYQKGRSSVAILSGICTSLD